MNKIDGGTCTKWKNLIIAFEDFINIRMKWTGGKYSCDIVSVLYHTELACVVAE